MQSGPINLAVVLITKEKDVEGQYQLHQANQGVCRWFLNSPLVKKIGESLLAAIVGDDSIQRTEQNSVRNVSCFRNTKECFCSPIYLTEQYFGYI